MGVVVNTNIVEGVALAIADPDIVVQIFWFSSSLLLEYTTFKPLDLFDLISEAENTPFRARFLVMTLWNDFFLFC